MNECVKGWDLPGFHCRMGAYVPVEGAAHISSNLLCHTAELSSFYFPLSSLSSRLGYDSQGMLHSAPFPCS